MQLQKKLTLIALNKENEILISKERNVICLPYRFIDMEDSESIGARNLATYLTGCDHYLVKNIYNGDQGIYDGVRQTIFVSGTLSNVVSLRHNNYLVPIKDLYKLVCFNANKENIDHELFAFALGYRVANIEDESFSIIS